MIDGSEKRNRQLAFELQNSHVCEKRSKYKKVPMHGEKRHQPHSQAVPGRTESMRSKRYSRQHLFIRKTSNGSMGILE